MTRSGRIIAIVAALLAATSVSALATQPSNPIVTIRVTLPDGQTKDVTAPESGVATIAAKDGTEYGFRPTIVDSRPWSRVVVTIFKMPTSTQAARELGTVELKTGGAAVQSKTTPAFKIAVPTVAPPPASSTT